MTPQPDAPSEPRYKNRSPRLVERSELVQEIERLREEVAKWHAAFLDEHEEHAQTLMREYEAREGMETARQALWSLQDGIHSALRTSWALPESTRSAK